MGTGRVASTRTATFNWANGVVKTFGKTMWAWNDVLEAEGSTGVVTIERDIVLDHWSGAYKSPSYAVSNGHLIVNSDIDYTYYALGKPQWNADPVALYDTWELYRLAGGGLTPGHPGILGGKMHIWCDWPTDETEEQIAEGTFESVRSISLKLWGSPKPVPDYEQFAQLVHDLGRAPGVTLPAPQRAIPQTNWSLVYVDSEETSGEDGRAINSFDGNTSTIWHTEWQSSNPPHPHEIQIDLGDSYDLTAFRYLPRQGSTHLNGTIADYEFYVSTSTSNWGSPVASGTFAANDGEKEVSFATTTGRYIRLVALSEVNGNPWTSAAEINLIAGVSGPTPTPGPTSTPAPPTDTPVTTDTPEPQYAHVGDIALSYQKRGANYRALATVTLLDASDQPVGTATVYGEFTGSTNDSVSGDTAGDGTVTLQSTNKKKGGSWTFCVTDVVKSGWTYDDASNVETCDSIAAP